MSVALEDGLKVVRERGSDCGDVGLELVHHVMADGDLLILGTQLEQPYSGQGMNSTLKLLGFLHYREQFLKVSQLGWSMLLPYTYVN